MRSVKSTAPASAKASSYAFHLSGDGDDAPPRGKRGLLDGDAVPLRPLDEPPELRRGELLLVDVPVLKDPLQHVVLIPGVVDDEPPGEADAVPWRRRRSAPKEWNVPSHGTPAALAPPGNDPDATSPADGSPPGTSAFATRSRISSAARFVKVIPRMLLAGTPSRRRRTMRATIARVFPDPAPATRRSGPPSCRTARRWSGSSVVKIASESIAGTDRLLPYETGQGTASGDGMEGRIRSPPEATSHSLRNATAGVRLL